MKNADVLALLKMKPEKAIEYLAQKTGKPSFWWWEQWKDAQGQAFTAAKAMKEDVLSTLQGALKKAQDEGQTSREFSKGLYTTLDKLGWFGVQTTKDPETGEEVTHDVAPWRIELIYQQNMQTAYQAAQWKEFTENAESRPFLEYDAAMEALTCPVCAALNGIVRPIDDEFWKTHFPPLHFRCKCQTRALTPKQRDERIKAGKAFDPPDLRKIQVEQKISRAEGHTTLTTGYTFTRDGKPFKSVPSAGFDYNCGVTSWAKPPGPPADGEPSAAPATKKPAPPPVSTAAPPTLTPAAKRSQPPIKMHFVTSDPILKKYANDAFTNVPRKNTALAKKAMSGTTINSHSGRSAYDHGTDTITMRNSAVTGLEHDTIRHEIGHVIDMKLKRNTNKLSDEKIFRDAIIADRTRLEDPSSAKELQEIITELNIQNKFVNDLFFSITWDGIKVIGYGHLAADYIANNNHPSAEVFAELYEISCRKNRKLWNFIKKHLPETSKKFKEILMSL